MPQPITSHEEARSPDSRPAPEIFVGRVPREDLKPEFERAMVLFKGYASLARPESAVTREQRESSAGKARYWRQVAVLLDRRLNEAGDANALGEPEKGNAPTGRAPDAGPGRPGADHRGT